MGSGKGLLERDQARGHVRGASSVFSDSYARIIDDPDHSDYEERFIILGMSRRARMLTVCHCYRQDDSVIRIISARKATKTEERAYWRYCHES